MDPEPTMLQEWNSCAWGGRGSWLQQSSGHVDLRDQWRWIWEPWLLMEIGYYSNHPTAQGLIGLTFSLNRFIDTSLDVDYTPQIFGMLDKQLFSSAAHCHGCLRIPDIDVWTEFPPLFICGEQWCLVGTTDSLAYWRSLYLKWPCHQKTRREVWAILHSVHETPSGAPGQWYHSQ